MNKYSKNNHLKGVITLLLVTTIWGSGFVATDIAISSFNASFVLLIRFLVAFLAMLIVSFNSIKSMKKTALKRGLLLGIVAFVAFYFLTIGLQYTTPSKSAFVTATNVIMVPFIGIFLIGNQINKKNILAAFITLIGVAFLTLDSNFAIGRGDLLTGVGAVLFAFHIVWTGEFSREENVSHLILVQMGISFLMALLLFVIGGYDFSMDYSVKGMGALLYLGLFPTALAFAMQTWAQKYTTETEAAVILSFESVIGTIFSIAIVGEQMNYKMIIGSALILFSIFISEINMAKLFNKST